MSAHAEAHSPPRAARGEPELAGRRADRARDAPLHRLGDHALRLVLHGLLLRPGRQPGRAAEWPPEPFHLPVFVAGVNTAILVTSSFTMHWALQSIKRGNRAGLQAGLVLTLPDGPRRSCSRRSLEYARSRLQPGDGAFASIFFGLTGLHGAHVFVGLTLLTVATVRGVPRPLLAGAPPRCRDPGHLLALRRRNVDRGLLDDLPALSDSADARTRFGSEADGVPLPAADDRRTSR